VDLPLTGSTKTGSTERIQIRAHRSLRGVVRASLGCIAALGVGALHAAPEPARPTVIDPTTLQWSSPPTIPELESAWVVGAEQAAGSYALRVKLRKGGRIPPHTHPDLRHTVVLSGSVYVGFGPKVDESAMVAVKAGEVYVAPAGVPHYVWARDGDVEYQENGRGPTATSFVSSAGGSP